MRPRTDGHDIDVKVRNARRFLLDGDKVKVNLRFMGRELAHQEFGMKTLRKVQEMLMDVAMVETPPKLEGKQAFLLLAPDPVKVKEYLKNQPKPELIEDKDDHGDADAEEQKA